MSAEPDPGRTGDEGASGHGFPRSGPEGSRDPSRAESEAEGIFAEARRVDREGREADAGKLYRKVLALDPGHIRARNNLGVLLDRQGAHEAAADHFRTALEHDPENPELLGNLGAALGGQGRYAQAERELRKAARLAPNRVDVRANLGILHFRRGLYAQAETELAWVCGEDPEHGPAHVYRGESLNRLGRSDQALEVLERASHLEPDNPRIFQLMGILYDRKHLPHEAAVMYRRARELTRG